MSVLVNLGKHYQAKDAESSSGFDPPAIPSSRLGFLRQKKSTYKYKAITFCNRSPEDVLEWEKKLFK
eukprot:12040009-Ditylum_brightwellii.AAC.1